MRLRLGRNLVTRAKPKKVKHHHHTPITEPTSSELSVFRKHIERLAKSDREAKVLIVGPSPELRSLTARSRLRTTIIADDLEVIERTSKAMGKKSEREHWLEGRIDKLPLRKRSFDLVIGDHIVSNVFPFDKSWFYKRLNEVLKKKGSAVIRPIVFRGLEESFERKISRHFRIVEKEHGKKGAFSEYFPIYFLRPK